MMPSCINYFHWLCLFCLSTENNQMVQSKQFQPKETLVFIRLIKYALQALDIFTITIPTPGQPQPRAIPK